MLDITYQSKSLILYIAVIKWVPLYAVCHYCYLTVYIGVNKIVILYRAIVNAQIKISVNQLTPQVRRYTPNIISNCGLLKS